MILNISLAILRRTHFTSWLSLRWNLVWIHSARSNWTASWKVTSSIRHLIRLVNGDLLWFSKFITNLTHPWLLCLRSSSLHWALSLMNCDWTLISLWIVKRVKIIVKTTLIMNDFEVLARRDNAWVYTGVVRNLFHSNALVQHVMSSRFSRLRGTMGCYPWVERLIRMRNHIDWLLRVVRRDQVLVLGIKVDWLLFDLHFVWSWIPAETMLEWLLLHVLLSMHVCYPILVLW